MNRENLFEQDWHDCLRAHYVHVITERDEANEKSLISVLHQTGFSDDEIGAIRAETVAALGWEENTETSDNTQAEIPEDIPPDVIEVTPPTAVPEAPPQAAQPAPVEPAQPTKPAEPDEPDEPPEPENFVQMSLF